jgi:hypothetical protein
VKENVLQLCNGQQVPIDYTGKVLWDNHTISSYRHENRIEYYMDGSIHREGEPAVEYIVADYSKNPTIRYSVKYWVMHNIYHAIDVENQERRYFINRKVVDYEAYKMYYDLLELKGIYEKHL